MVHATFVMEQHLGHQTYYQNLRQLIQPSPLLKSTWVPITYYQPGGLLERLPLPHGLRGSARGMLQVHHGLAADTCDVTFFNTQVPAVLGGARLRGKPYVIGTDLTPIQYDGMGDLYEHQPDRFGPLRQLKHQINAAVFGSAARLLPWSTWVRDSMIADYGVPAERIEVLPPGVDLERWQPGGERAPGPLRVLFVGGDFVRKGGEMLLGAFRALPPGVAELHLVTRAAIAPEPGVCVYNDMRPNDPALVRLYQQADIFALPSGAEAFGIAVAEAAACGLPAIVSNVGGLTDIVADGETGFLVRPDDYAGLGGRLRALAEDQGLRERMGRAARVRAERLFDTRRNAARLVACLVEAAQQSRELRYA